MAKLNFTEARLRVADIDISMPIPKSAKEVTFKVKLAAVSLPGTTIH